MSCDKRDRFRTVDTTNDAPDHGPAEVRRIVPPVTVKIPLAVIARWVKRILKR